MTSPCFLSIASVAVLASLAVLVGEGCVHRRRFVLPLRASPSCSVQDRARYQSTNKNHLTLPNELFYSQTAKHLISQPSKQASHPSAAHSCASLRLDPLPAVVAPLSARVKAGFALCRRPIATQVLSIRASELKIKQTGQDPYWVPSGRRRVPTNAGAHFIQIACRLSPTDNVTAVRKRRGKKINIRFGMRKSDR